MKGSREDLIRYRLSRALETLKEAETLIENGFWNASVNRIYYACFYSVSALLLSIDNQNYTHKGVRMLFGMHFVQKGIISKEFGKFFSDLYDRRQVGDYDDFVTYDKEVSDLLLAKAKLFIEEVIKIIGIPDLEIL